MNTGRGSTVDEAAMIRALDEGWIAYAALDVLEKEPPDPGNPLLGMDNVTLTAHVASASSRFEVGSRRRVGREIALVLGGRWPLSCVNPSVLDSSGTSEVAAFAVVDHIHSRSVGPVWALPPQEGFLDPEGGKS